MQWPSISVILTELFLCYTVYSIFMFAQLFDVPECTAKSSCLVPFLLNTPNMELHIFCSTTKNPSELTPVYVDKKFNYSQPQTIDITLNIPKKTQQNGTLFMHIVFAPDTGKSMRSFFEVKLDPYMVYTTIKMTQYVVPQAEAFILLKEKDTSKKKKAKSSLQPTTHIRNKISFTIMTDKIQLPMNNVPVELLNDMKIINNLLYLPLMNSDFLQTRHRDLMRVTPSNKTINLTISYTPISIGKLRFMLHIEAAVQSLKNLGFSDKDIDEVKGIFADTNIYLLAGTFFISAVHLLFDFLAIKNDLSFWRTKKNLIGLSKWTVTWRAFSQIIIFLHLLDENSSLLIIIPTGIGTIIELWKMKKVFKAEFVCGLLPRLKFNKTDENAAELKTREFDAQSMRYLSYLLYPLVIAGAIYSLLYQPHRSWYSWSINSLVNGVYVFGFLFMLPQLFVNYKLKSVAHLPWRAFMYKAFNTFIDDIFAFIITMPVAHRIACFRDDAVFLIYLYQRWLYPVDKSRTDIDSLTDESLNIDSSNKKLD